MPNSKKFEGDMNDAPPPFPAQQQPIKTPDITLSGDTVDRMMLTLNAPAVWVKGQDGALHGFVDPQPIMAALRDTVLAEWQRLGWVRPDGTIGPPPQAESKPN